MPRRARVVIAGAPHHVTQRGNRRQTTFFRDGDYLRYLQLAAEACAKADVECWGYCLMPNHVHLILTPRAPGDLRAALVPLHWRYTFEINKRERWTGYLWQGRFASFAMDEAYFARVDAIHYTIAHDDGVGWENWEEADIVLAGVSRSSKTPTSIYLANRGYKVANIPIVVESPPPPALFGLRHPLVVGLTTAPERLVQVRRNRLLSLGQSPETAYVDDERVAREVQYARRMFADNGWPVIDVTRRSIEEAAAAIINLYNEFLAAQGGAEG